jgi:hypothetical protein
VAQWKFYVFLAEEVVEATVELAMLAEVEALAV